jgi:predicted glycosyltransferase
MAAFVEAARRLRPLRGGTWLMVTGPMTDDATHDRLARAGEAAGLTVRRSVPELRAHVALADCVVGMAGYNTCCDLLTFRRPGVLVPRPGPSAEQTIRAEQLGSWGVANVIVPGDTDRIDLTDAIAAALDGDGPAKPPVRIDGLDAAVEVFDRTRTSSGTPA